MRFLVVNHLRLGSVPGGIPDHHATERSVHSMRAAWFRAVDLAVEQHVHALFLTGEIIASKNTSLEPFGPLGDGLSRLHQAQIPVVVISDGRLTEAIVDRYNMVDGLQFLETRLDWDPPIVRSTEPVDGPSVHIVAASLAETSDAPVAHPITLADIDQPHSIWVLTDAHQPDSFDGEHALVVESGAIAPLFPEETGRHGAWLFDTDRGEATLMPLATLEYASIEIDLHSAQQSDDVERLIAQALMTAAARARGDGSIASNMLVNCTLTGRTRLFGVLGDIANELRHTLTLEHEGMSISMTDVAIDAVPDINLEALVGRADPVGEVARLVHALDSGDDLTDAHAKLVIAAEQKLLAVTRARVFGAIVDTDLTSDAQMLLRRQGWATLDALVHQRGID